MILYKKYIRMKLYSVLIPCLSVFTFWITPVSAANECSSSCTIQNQTDTSITTYQQNNKIIIGNVMGWISSSANGAKKVFVAKSTQIFNLVSNWPDYFTGADYFAMNVISDVPLPIKRDLEKLEKEGESLNKILKKILEKWATNSVITDACKWVDNCELPRMAWEIMGTLISNNNSIIELYKLSLLWKEWQFSTPLILVDKNFKSQLQKAYNQHTFSWCSNCKWWFKEISHKAIKAIQLSDDNATEGIKEWQEAFDLIYWIQNDSEEAQLKERELLKEEMYRNWVSTENWQALLDNLDRYNNNWWYSKTNNPLHNTFNTFANSADVSGAIKLIKRFPDVAAQAFNRFFWNGWNPATSIQTFSVPEISSTVGNSNEIMKNINLLYDRELPFAQPTDQSNDKLRGRVIQMHMDLSEAINELERVRPTAEKVCNDQDKWAGICTFKYF